MKIERERLIRRGRSTKVSEKMCKCVMDGMWPITAVMRVYEEIKDAELKGVKARDWMRNEGGAEVVRGEDDG